MQILRIMIAIKTTPPAAATDGVTGALKDGSADGKTKGDIETDGVVTGADVETMMSLDAV